MTKLVDEAFDKAKEVMDLCLCEKGFRASACEVDGYSQVWARDFGITFLGASQMENEGYKSAAKRSLECLTAAQSALGWMPNCVDLYSDMVETDNAGAIDANMWYIITHYIYWKAYNDDEPLKKHYENIERGFTWLCCQDSNNCGLIESQEASDWEDIIANRYNVLYANVLFYATVKALAKIREVLGKPVGNLVEMAERLNRDINLRFWIDNSFRQDKFNELVAIRTSWAIEYRQIASVLFRSRFYLPYVAFRDWAYRCDSFGNSLAIILGIADEARTNSILSHFENSGMNRPYPIKVLDPPIMEGAKDWRDYYTNFGLNMPHQCLNGGIWPFLGGFYIASLVKAGHVDMAAKQLEALAQVNKLGKTQEWDFNEWLHGLWATPMGAAKQAWSAGMYIYAYNAVKNEKCEYFDGIS